MTEYDILQLIMRYYGFPKQTTPANLNKVLSGATQLVLPLGFNDINGPIIRGYLRKTKKLSLSMKDHIRALVYSLLSSNRSWGPIAANASYIDTLFNFYDPNYLKNVSSTVLISGIKLKKLGNRSIRKQMSKLKDNIIYLETLSNNHGNLDTYYDVTVSTQGVQTLVRELTKNLDNFGIALTCEYLKNIGIDVCKPDTHVVRFISDAYLNWEPSIHWASGKEPTDKTKLLAIECIERVAKKTGFTSAEVDALIWNFCNDQIGVCHSITTSTPCPNKAIGKCPISTECMHI